VISRVFFRLIQFVGRLVFSFYAPLTIRGAEHVPPTGAFLLAINHVSALDPIVVYLACPRRVVFLAKDELWRSFLFRIAAGIFHIIPVDRDNPNTTTVKRSLRALQSGVPVLIAPEGTRSDDGQLREFKSGFVKLARKARVPVVPVAVNGTFEVMPRQRKFPKPGRIAVSFGQPYTEFLDGNLKEEEISWHTRALNSTIASLLKHHKI
jgi:1-acyl-sn-glycerol-3-phosphate acyltransferase